MPPRCVETLATLSVKSHGREPARTGLDGSRPMQQAQCSNAAQTWRKGAKLYGLLIATSQTVSLHKRSSEHGPRPRSGIRIPVQQADSCIDARVSIHPRRVRLFPVDRPVAEHATADVGHLLSGLPRQDAVFT